MYVYYHWDYNQYTAELTISHLNISYLAAELTMVSPIVNMQYYEYTYT